MFMPMSAAAVCVSETSSTRRRGAAPVRRSRICSASAACTAAKAQTPVVMSTVRIGPVRCGTPSMPWFRATIPVKACATPSVQGRSA